MSDMNRQECEMQTKLLHKMGTPQPLAFRLNLLVKWLKADFEMTMHRIRPLQYCKGRGCYVLTPGRKEGRPYCLACREENNSFAI